MLEIDFACGIYHNIAALEFLGNILAEGDREIKAEDAAGLGQICRLVKKDLEAVIAEAEKPKK